MKPWELLDSSPTPGSGEELRLYQRDTEFSITVGKFELMNSRHYGSEDALALLACQKMRHHPGERVLIGGLGMGFTLRTVLNTLGAGALVEVAELVPAVVEWNRGVLADLAGSPLDDRRVTLQEADVAQIIRDARSRYDAILLDVDNGPQGLTRQGNDWLYQPEGLRAAFAALRSGGVLAVWSACADPKFVRRLRRTGFAVEEVGVRGRVRGAGKGGVHHVVWTATRA